MMKPTFVPIILLLVQTMLPAFAQAQVFTDTRTDGSPAGDRIAIQNLINAYSRTADRRQADDQGALFVIDGKIEVYHQEPDGRPDTTLDSRYAIRTAIESAQGKYDLTMHVNGQVTIELTGDSATGEVYCLAHHFLKENGKKMIFLMGIRYYDTYVRKNNHWYFKLRKMIVDWTDKRPSFS